MSDKNSGEVILSFLLGCMAGAVAGILFAPRSGKETREKLMDLSEEFGDKAGHIIKDVKSKAGHIVEEVKEKAGHIVEEGKEKILSQKERIEAAVEAGKKAYDKK